MRALWLCLGFTCAAALSGACGDGAAQDQASTPQGGAGRGGAAVSASGHAGKNGGGASNAGASNAGAAGKSATSGSGGGGTANSSAGAGGDVTSGGQSDGSAGWGTGGAPSNGGEPSAAGGSAGGDGAAGAASECNVADPDKLIFVSSELYTGALGGLTGADSKCQALAKAAGLCGTYMAWLSDGTGDAASRLAHATGNYVLRSGQVVASDWSDLTSGKLQHAVNLTETNAAAPVGTVKCGGSPIAPVWTGATYSGAGGIPNGSCSNWGSTSYTPGAIFGNANATNLGWSGECQLTAVCQSTAALYCLQQ